MAEVSKSHTADRLGIDNTPSTEVIEAARMTAEHILQPIRDHYGIPFSPQSWFRGEDLERELTKSAFLDWCDDKQMQSVDPESWKTYFGRKSHPKGEAVDIELPGISNDDLFEWCRYNIPVYDQLIREFRRSGDPRSGWVHISYRKNNNRQQTLAIS